MFTTSKQLARYERKLRIRNMVALLICGWQILVIVFGFVAVMTLGYYLSFKF
ncbi:MAG: hypothetical protein BWY21_01907 [Parcubacteria group bacterium ADurb.Bin216]|nr:MAG: hypothetical protein BWY21_01907 [Parcubacteria group bacterium ADurb.Bin216]